MRVKKRSDLSRMCIVLLFFRCRGWGGVFRDVAYRLSSDMAGLISAAGILHLCVTCLALWAVSATLAVPVVPPIQGNNACTSYNCNTLFACNQLDHQDLCVGEPVVQNVTVGRTVAFLCQSNLLRSVPSWSINSTLYHWSKLPDDYKFYTDTVADKYAFIIPVAKLWMNNTQFGCANGTTSLMIGCLYVSFGKNFDVNYLYDT